MRTGNGPDQPADDRSVQAGSWPGVSRRAFLGSTGALLALTGCTAGAGGRPVSSADSASAAPTGDSTPDTTASPSSRPVRSAVPDAAPSTPTGPAREVMRGRGDRPEVALTFHGAGDPRLATAIVGVATSARAAVTVMAVGTWLAANPAIAKQIKDSGHELGNHTWSHPVLRDLDRSRARPEIERCRDELQRLTGSPGRWFRQSGSQHSTPLIRALAGAAGYPVCLSYDIDSLDWTDPGPAAIVTNVRAATAGSIVSMHLGHPGTLSALPAVLRSLRERGLRAVTVTELLAA